jgi:transposase
MTVAITRQELGAVELRREARRCRDTAASRRMLALALVLEGSSREEAARAAGMDRQTLRDWVHRYNAEGLAGLRDRPRSGRRPRLTAEQEAELVTAVERGPDPDRDGVVRWRRVDLRALIEARFAVRLHERTVGKVLRRLGLARLSVGASQAPEGGRGGAGGVQKGFAELVREALPERARGRPVEIWFQDEARVGQQGTLTRVWARRGTRPRAPRDRRYAWAYLFGAVCPERAVGAGLVLPYANTKATGLHLAEIGRQVAPGAHAVVVLDGAGWHAAGGLAVPENLTLLPLPRYSPELNPVENVWEYLRQNKLGLRVWPDYDAIVATCCEAWNWLVAAPDRLASITRREWARAVSN